MGRMGAEDPATASARDSNAGKDSVLATAAEDGGASRDANECKRPPAGDAGLAGASVDEQLFLLAAHVAPCVAIRIDRAAAVPNRHLERVAEGFMQAPNRFPAQTSRGAIRPQPCAVQRFVCVDVAD